MYAPNPFETMPIVLDAKAQEEQLIASLLDGDISSDESDDDAAGQIPLYATPLDYPFDLIALIESLRKKRPRGLPNGIVAMHLQTAQVVAAVVQRRVAAVRPTKRRWTRW